MASQTGWDHGVTDRTPLIESFLASANWANAQRHPLAGDASSRRYERLSHPDHPNPAVLMDAPISAAGSVTPFVRIAAVLAQHGLRPPEILAQDLPNGLLLLEDFGDALFTQVLQDDTGDERELYRAATDVLCQLHTLKPMSDLSLLDAEELTQLATLPWQWYPVHEGVDRTAAMAQYVERFQPLLHENLPQENVLIHRDYHAGNLIWLPENTGTARVGLLDFQDAVRGPRAYDLVSLLQDARRDVPSNIEDQMKAHFLAHSPQDQLGFERTYALLGFQRNLRIVGIFARLCLRDAKPHYLEYLPRVWAHMMRNLDHPVLAPMRPLIHAAFPSPSKSLVQELKHQCPAP